MSASLTYEPLDQRNVVELVRHLIVEETLLGSSVLDGTAGNGHDTLTLAEAVGPTGHVMALDIANHAIRSADRRLTEAGVRDRVELIQGDHGDLATLCPEGAAPFSIAVFNLGYLPGHLPGGLREQLTAPASTVNGLDAALARLAPGGLLVASCYTGHPEGLAEAEAVRRWASEVAPRCGSVRILRDQGPDAAGRPEVIIVRGRA